MLHVHHAVWTLHIDNVCPLNNWLFNVVSYNGLVVALLDHRVVRDLQLWSVLAVMARPELERQN